MVPFWLCREKTPIRCKAVINSKIQVRCFHSPASGTCNAALPLQHCARMTKQNILNFEQVTRT